MRNACLALWVAGLVWAGSTSARADEKATALLEKALKAHGGAEALAKFPASTSSFKGTFYGMGAEIPMTGQVSTMGSDKIKMDLEVEAGGMKIQICNVINGDKGWAKVANNVMELDKDTVAEARENAYAGYLANLYPLKGKEFTLAHTGEHKVKEQTVYGLRVSSKGHRDVTLYFDKETSLLVKSEETVKEEGSGQQVTQESFFSEYKEVQGIKQATKFKIHRDGKPYLEGETSEVHLSEKLEDSVFAKP